MGANAFEYNVKLNLNADTNLARTQINSLQQQLKSISNLQFNFNGINALTSEINEASNAALKLQTSLQAALNPNTGNLDFSKFTSSIQRSGDSLQNLSSSLLNIGPQGTKTFISLADSISRSEVPLIRTNKLVNGLWDNLKKTAGWQISSSVIHGLMGSVQQAVGYAQALDKSLTDIRIVTGQSAEQMARFAKEANKAAKQLSATTTDYTNASLIYYQQGLSDAEVKKRSEITIKMANATGTSASKVSDQMTSIWNNFADGSKSLEHYADVMTALGAATASSTDEIARGIQKFAAISDTVGLSYEYAASALATITATTRESADTVGNSLKTLFSRIQGLNLGETLDDGTTLNKYSTALAKVGISIKDNSGALKDMDAILDEMGAKWHTLAEDQQMALAQTVGGVRQYTQIMTLMENWDFFKENLTTATTATGALTQQANIYADSWEAAQKRMKASWETMWDSLIDSDSFKKILNIGATIVESIGHAFAGLGGTGGVLGSAFSIFGNLFKDQLSSAVGDGIYNLTHMTPKARNTMMNERIQTVQNMANTIRDPSYNPNMGDVQRNLIADQIESQAQQRIAYAQNSKYMNSQDIALYAELDKRVQATRESRRQIAEQIDAGSMLVAHGRYADESDVERFTRDYQTPGPQYGSVKAAKERAKIEQTQQFGWALTQEQSLMFNEAGERVRTSAASLGDVLEVLGERSAVAGRDIQEMTSWLASGQKRTSEDIQNNQEGTEFTIDNLYRKTDKGYEGTAYEMYRDLLGITTEESAKINSGNLQKGTREYALNEILAKELKGLSGVIDSSKGMTDTERAQAIQGYLQKSIAGIGDKALAGLGVSTSKDASVRRGGIQIFTGAKQRKEGELKDQPLSASEKQDTEAMSRLAQKRIEMGRTVTSGLLGASGTASGMAGLEGAFSSLLNGNIAGVATGVGSAAMNFRMANQNYAEMFSGFKNIVSDKQMEKANLLIQQKDLQNFRSDYEAASDQYFDISQRLNIKDISQEERDSLLEQQNTLKQYLDSNKQAYKKSNKDLKNVETSLKGLQDVDIGKSPEVLTKVGGALKTVAANAQAMATAVQVATVTFKAVNSALTYIADTNKRNAQNANTAATQLQSAYAMNQNNHNALLSSIEQYDKALEKATDTNLKGAEKQAAIYEQNSIAADLIAKYGISQFAKDGSRNYSRIGDTLKISDRALEAAKEQSISNMAISKYAADRAKVDAKIASSEYSEETLERKMGMSETGWFTGAAIGGGIAAGAGAAALMGSTALAAIAGPIGWAALAIGAGLAATGAINMAQRDNSIVDEAIEISKSQGSMLWLDNAKAGDNINGHTFTQSELNKLRDNKDEIQKLVANEKAASLQSQLIAENTARDILKTNEETEDFKYADRLIEGLVKQQEDWYIAANKNNYNGWDTSKAKIAAAKEIEEELGLTGKNVVWTDDNKNGRLTYTYTENGQQQNGELSYDSLETLEATKKGKQETDKYISQMMDIYNTIKDNADQNGELAATGMLSLLSGGNFDTATYEEIEAAKKFLGQENLQALLTTDFASLDMNYGEGSKYQQLADAFGIKLTEADYGNYAWAISRIAQESGYEDTQSWINNLNNFMTYQPEDYTNLLNDFSEQYSTWFNNDNNSGMLKKMSQESLRDLYSELSFISKYEGEEAGQKYLDGLMGIINESGIDESKKAQALSALLSLDYSDWNIDNSVIDTIKSFGGAIDNTSLSVTNFTSVMREMSTTVPDVVSELTNLTQIAGSLQDIKIGDKISSDTITALQEANYGEAIESAVFHSWSGDNIVTGSTEQVLSGIRNEIGTVLDEQGKYQDYAANAFGGTKEQQLESSREIADLGKADFEAGFLDETKNEDLINFATEVLGENGEQKINTLQSSINRKSYLDQFIQDNYKLDGDGNLTAWKDVSGKWHTAEKDSITGEYTGNTAIAWQNYQDVNQSRQDYQDEIDRLYGEITTAAENAALDPAEIEAKAEEYVSTFNSFEEAMADSRTQKLIENQYLSEADALMYYASKYPELTEYVNAYNEAMANNNTELANSIKKQTELNVAMYDTLAAYQAATGKKTDIAGLTATISHLKEKEDIQESYSYTDENGNIVWDEKGLIKVAEETMIAAVGEQAIDRYGSSWQSDINAMMTDPDKTQDGGQALAYMGKAVQQYLGLMDQDILGLTSQNPEENPLYKLIDDGIVTLEGIISKDVDQMRLLRVELMKQTTAGRSLTAKLNGNTADGEYNDKTKTAMSNFKKAATEDEQSLEELSDENAAMMEQIGKEGGFADFEEYQAAVVHESGGRYKANDTGTMSYKGTGDYAGQTLTIGAKWDKTANNGQGGWMGVQTWTDDTGVTHTKTVDPSTLGDGVTVDNLTGADLDTSTAPTPSGGGGGGGGGGGPTKVQVKSAQEIMTRYKTTDQKLTNNEMQKTAALQAKDLLYGKSKINQLEKINTLLRKQQQLTADRIEEELDYLESDKEKIIEVLERYNKDAKDEDKISIEFDSQGLISNYKQVIGAWAEELASYYLDGELTAEEGKKAEELQKKIQDFNTLIKDYEDSLNQLASSIEQYETTLYEMLSNDIEAMAHNIEYQIDINNDDISYLDFYMTNIKDSIGSVIDYLELLGSKVSESASQIGIYEQGYVDLVDFINENPLQLWATQGVEGMLTAEQVTTLRSYRDGLMSVYQTALSVRKEIEDQTLKVFDYWNNKIDKSVESISRFTDMLSQFKDIINIVGKDAMGLSNTFMKTFEQQSIDQSFDNIAVNRTQYEHLVQVYEDAQEKLETARASGNERDIEYWEKVVDETQEAMEGAQDALLTTLQHSLNAIAEQFTNTVTIALEEFEESVYKFNGLDGMIADYEQIKEKQDLMVADYEKIYSLNKLNRDLEKTLNNSNILAGKSKLLEFQQKINKINESNVELSQYELEYLQAEYDLKVAEMELENARNSKDTVMLSKDSEGNWSYVYTQNANAVEDAEQKVEDALYKMQQLSYEYTDEMSQAMMSISQQMRDEISALSIQDFASAEEYYNEISRIQDKYSEQLAHREDELNKAISNNAALYEEDWANYSAATGYKISADSEWIDSFKETTLGGLIGSGSDISNFSTLITQSTNEMNEALGKAASTYFVNADKALNTYGSSLKGFGATVSMTTSNIINSSKNATKEVTSLANTLVDKFAEISDTVESELAEWTEEIGNKLEELLETIKEINKLIADSASKELPDTNEIIGQEEAVQRLQSAEFENKDFNNWTWSEEGQVAAYGDKGLNLVEFNAELVQKVNDALQAYANTPTADTEERAKKLEELNKLIKDYWTFKRILEKIYDPTNIKIEDLEVPDTGAATQMATGGYTGEWGNEGKWAVLHEKELVLSADDTANFLDALTISRDLVNSMIEMNAKQSSFALGDLVPNTIQDLSSTLEQQVSIVAEFPNAVYHNEIEDAFDNLMNTASQYANRYKI